MTIVSDTEKALAKMLKELLDYTTCMEMATNYTTGRTPDYIAMYKMLNEIVDTENKGGINIG